MTILFYFFIKNPSLLFVSFSNTWLSARERVVRDSLTAFRKWPCATFSNNSSKKY